MNKLLLAAVAACAFASAADAQILVDFSFDSTIGTPGHITGQLVFDNAGTDVAASHAYIFSAPAGTVNAFGQDYLTPGAFVITNAFTVSLGGIVSAADLEVTNAAYTDFLNLNASVNGHANMVSNQVVSGYAFNVDGFAGATYTPHATAAAVPEPASWAMMLGGFGLVGGAMRSRRKAAVSFA